MDALQGVLLEFVAVILGLLLSLVAAYGAMYVRKMSANLQERSEFDALDKVISRVERLALKAVSAVEQESASLIREAVTVGKVTKEEGREQLKTLAQDAYMRVTKELGSKAILLLGEQKVDIEQLVRDSIEEAVEKVKNPF